MRLLFVGFGTVAQGLAKLLIEKKNLLKKEYGFDYSVVGICDILKGSCYDEKGLDLKKILEKLDKTKKISGQKMDARAMIDQAKADVLLEATYTDIRTAEPATSHIKYALQKGMHVVTTNKGPIALFYKELVEIADRKNVKLRYEGTVMSGTPLISLIRDTLYATTISEIKGILNATTNYILTEMEEGASYEIALKKAQELGYAEAIPDADVLGWDTLAKVTIIANTIFGAELKPFDNPYEGITMITTDEIARAKEERKRYKLVGSIWREMDEVKVSVSLQKIDMSHPLANVMGVINAATLTTDTMGDITIIGKGAGKRETGYSMLADLISITKSIGK